MEMKPGYKQTEVGVIPEDWNLVKFRQIVVDNRIPSGVYKSQNFYGHGTKIIKISNVFGYDYFLPDLAQRVELTSEEISKYGVIVGDIIIALASVKLEGVGQVMLVNRLDENTAFDHNVALIRLIKAVNPGYIFYLFKSIIIRNLVGARATQVGTSFLKASTILEFPIPLPSNKAEQKAIAEALSDADALIESLEQLIAKKRQIKQGAMQELLTGKRRLPGFSGEWEVKEIQDISDIDLENLSSDTRPEYMFKYISLEEVDRGTLKGWTEQIFATAPSRARRKIRKDDILVSTVRPNLQSHCLIQSSVDDLICSTGFSVIRCRSGIAEPYYVFAHFFASFIEKQIEVLVTGSNYPAINSSDVRHIKILMPPKFSEQIAIAAILSDMDAEIAALEEKLGKARQVKQGMMQELLTGRVRIW